jgi:hypothetical protein
MHGRSSAGRVGQLSQADRSTRTYMYCATVHRSILDSQCGAVLLLIDHGDSPDQLIRRRIPCCRTATEFYGRRASSINVCRSPYGPARCELAVAVLDLGPRPQTRDSNGVGSDRSSCGRRWGSGPARSARDRPSQLYLAKLTHKTRQEGETYVRISEMLREQVSAMDGVQLFSTSECCSPLCRVREKRISKEASLCLF